MKKKLGILLGIVLMLGCTKEKLPTTFLEKYNNTFWEAADGGSSNLGFYDDPFQFIWTQYCSVAGFGDFTITTPDDFIITKNTPEALYFSIVFITECDPIIYLDWKVDAYEEEQLIMLTRKKLIGYKNCELYKDGGDFSTGYYRSEKNLDAVCNQTFFSS